MNVKLVIAWCRDLNIQLGYIASASELGTQRDDVKFGGADGEARVVVMPLEWHYRECEARHRLLP